MTDRARSLRRRQTSPESLLWSRLRAGRLDGLKFRRQHPIDCFVVDFYCHDAKLAIELDGMSHVGAGNRDEQRTVALQRIGVDVIRVTNDDVLLDIDAVCEYVLREVRKRVAGSRHPHPSPLPEGEGVHA
ncbi:MAG: DUF559 domain-containing protein [Planctomycetota bacterium]